MVEEDDSLFRFALERANSHKAHVSPKVENQSRGALPGQYVTFDGLTMLQSYPHSTLEQIPRLVTSILDVCVASYPRSGSTWVEHILNLLNPGEFKERHVPLTRKIPLLERKVEEATDTFRVGNALELVKSRKSPRFFKTHLPPRYLQTQVDSDNLKVIFVVRDLKDTLVSYYHYHKMSQDFGPYDGDWDAFFALLRAGGLVHGRMDETVEDWLCLKERDNVLVVRYEDLKQRRLYEVARIARFCDLHVPIPRLMEVAYRSSFHETRIDPSINLSIAPRVFIRDTPKYLRRGEMGTWKEQFTREQRLYIEDYMDRMPAYRELYPRDLEDEDFKSGLFEMLIQDKNHKN